MTLVKRIIFTVVYVVVALFVPLSILAIFVDATEHSAVWFIVIGAILFATMGLILANVVSQRKTIEKTMEDIQMQNAAIAYKLSAVFKDNPEALDAVMQQMNAAPDDGDKDEIDLMPAFEEEKKEPAVDTSRVTLNPADPLVFPEKKPDKKNDAPKAGEKSENKKSGNFDDFD
ncbi:MAG: hypothetical protein II738_05895 [Clostridia bacterium]|nr:hypothetical protein [Clostridia bacterium]